MKYNVTVEQAIARGRKLCVYLPMFFFFGFMALGLSLAIIYQKPWLAGVFIPLGIVLGWLSWSVAVVQWKIWAYTNVRNVHDLKKRAIEGQIMHKDGSFFNRTEIKSQDQLYQLEQLQQRFRDRDVFNDDEGVPSETYIYISKKKVYIELAIGAAMIPFGVYLYFDAETGKDRFYSFILPAFGVFLLWKSYKALRNIKPIIVLSDEGIRLQSLGLTEWQDIIHDEVSTRDKEQKLIFRHYGGEDWVDIANLATNVKELRHLLRVYRGRFEEKNNSGL